MFNWLFGSASKAEYNLAIEMISELEDRLNKLENRLDKLESFDFLSEDDVERIVDQYNDRRLYEEVKGILREASISIDL